MIEVAGPTSSKVRSKVEAELGCAIIIPPSATEAAAESLSVIPSKVSL